MPLDLINLLIPYAGDVHEEIITDLQLCARMYCVDTYPVACIIYNTYVFSIV